MNTEYLPTITTVETFEDGWSVYVEDANGNEPSVWIDCWIQMEDLVCDFNKYIFRDWDAEDQRIKAFQESDKGMVAWTMRGRIWETWLTTFKYYEDIWM